MIYGTLKLSSACVVIVATMVISLAISTKTQFLPGTAPKLGSRINGTSNINYRLPNNTQPFHYNLELTTNFHNGTRDFTGQVQISLTATENTKTIVLHALELEDFKATIKSADRQDAVEYPMSWLYQIEREFLSLTAQDQQLNFNKGTNWTLTIAYKGQLSTDKKGFYILSYNDSAQKMHYMATTEFEPTFARKAFPCYDEPAKRATFQITIRHHPSYNALSNMPMNESASSNGVTVFAKTTVTMPTYLIAFHVSDFEYTEGALHSVPHRLYTKPEDVPIQEFGLVFGMIILEHLTNYYKIPYDLPRLVQVAIPEKDGGNEYWGMVTYGELDLLINKTTSTTSDLIDAANKIAHELTHQWIGNHVTIKWWTYLWVKEAFGRLNAYEAVNEVYREWDVYQIMHTDEYQEAMSSDVNGDVVPMTYYVQTPSEIDERYFISSYEKASTVLYMWKCALGDEIFRSTLIRYLNDNAFGAADEGQFFDAMQSAADEHKIALPAPIGVMFRTWSQQSGFPLLTVTRDYAKKKFTITQTAYNTNNTIASSNIYHVPFNYASTLKADFRNTTATHYFNTKELNIADNEVGADDWLILNKQSTGYYRINYDDKNWHLIAQGLVLRPNKIHALNRAQILDDAYEFVKTDRLQQEILLELLTYLPGEDQYAPWYTAATIITTYVTYLNGDQDYNDFKQFIASLVIKLYETLGVNEVPGEQLLRKFTRNRAVDLACLVGVENCLMEANEKLKLLINNGVPIEPNTKRQAYCNGLRKSSDNDYNYFFNDFLASSDTAYRSRLLRALGCSENEAQLQKFVSSTINMSNSLSDTERTSVLNWAYSSSGLGLLVCIDFLNNNWEAYGKLSNDTGSSNPLSQDIVNMANYVNNNDKQKRLLALVEKVKNSNIVESNLEDEVKANMKVNFGWLDKNRKPIMSFVKSYLSNSSAGS
ncbi:aminopeptidase N-like [Eurosta solidaginis]|uniref:aminopeptidase N-like n=1 Tax=Eurosta solidaginis TaxID=178769 RepID=UPI00353163AC